MVCACVKGKFEEQTLLMKTDLTPEGPQGSRTILGGQICVHVVHPLIHGAFTFNCPIIVFSRRDNCCQIIAVM